MRPETLTTYGRINSDAKALPVAQCEQVEALGSMLNDPIDAVILRRAMPIHVSDWVDSIERENLPSGRYILKADQVGACVAQLFEAYGHAASPARDWVCEDASALAAQVQSVAKTSHLRLRVDVIDDNACRKMHIDNVLARLICTYRGLGTELGQDGDAETVLDVVPTGAPVLLKGRLWPAETEPRLRHRSPQIEGMGQVRLVLVLEGCTLAEIQPAFDNIYQRAAKNAE